MPAELKGQKSPAMDASLGLIMRLNTTWDNAKNSRINGDLSQYNFFLDVIFTELSYESTFKVKKDDSGEIVDIDVSSEDEKIMNHFNNKINEYSSEMNKFLKLKNFQESVKNKNLYYAELVKKDKWLKTFMHKKGLYLRELEHVNSGAIV